MGSHFGTGWLVVRCRRPTASSGGGSLFPGPLRAGAGAGRLLLLDCRVVHSRRRLQRRLHGRGLRRGLRARARQPARPCTWLGDERPVTHHGDRCTHGRRGGLADRLARLADLRRRPCLCRQPQPVRRSRTRHGGPHARRRAAVAAHGAVAQGAGPARHRHRRTDLLRAGGGLFRHFPAGDLSPVPGRDRHSVGRVRAGQCRRDHPGRPARRPAARPAVDLCRRHGAVGRGCPRAFHVASQPHDLGGVGFRLRLPERAGPAFLHGFPRSGARRSTRHGAGAQRCHGQRRLDRRRGAGRRHDRLGRLRRVRSAGGIRWPSPPRWARCSTAGGCHERHDAARPAARVGHVVELPPFAAHHRGGHRHPAVFPGRHLRALGGAVRSRST